MATFVEVVTSWDFIVLAAILLVMVRYCTLPGPAQELLHDLRRVLREAGVAEADLPTMDDLQSLTDLELQALCEGRDPAELLRESRARAAVVLRTFDAARRRRARPHSPPATAGSSAQEGP
jgi:hypothetical protein